MAKTRTSSRDATNRYRAKCPVCPYEIVSSRSSPSTRRPINGCALRLSTADWIAATAAGLGALTAGGIAMIAEVILQSVDNQNVRTAASIALGALVGGHQARRGGGDAIAASATGAVAGGMLNAQFGRPADGMAYGGALAGVVEAAMRRNP